MNMLAQLAYSIPNYTVFQARFENVILHWDNISANFEVKTIYGPLFVHRVSTSAGQNKSDQVGLVIPTTN